MTRPLHFAVLGHPIAHSLSPAMHAAALAALGLPHIYSAVDARDEAALAERVGDLRRGIYAGLNVTVPYKRAVLALADRVDTSAAEIGAANTLVRENDGAIVAYNTDAAGLADDLRAIGALGRVAAVVGSGGAASAAVAACTAIGATVVAVTSRSWTSSELLVGAEAANRVREQRALTCLWPVVDPRIETSRISTAMRLQWSDMAASASIIVQATTAGMKGADPGETIASIIPWDRLGNDTLAYDLIYNPASTPFLRAAKIRGFRHANGLGMLARQGARALELWLGVRPDAEVMRAAAERALGGVR